MKRILVIFSHPALQSSRANRQLLQALSRERQDLYRQLGECFGARREELGKRTVGPQPRKPRVKPGKTKATVATEPEKEDA